MIFNIEQVKKELFTADFNIIENNCVIGTTQVNGDLETMNRPSNTVFQNKQLLLNPAHMGVDAMFSGHKPYRPYAVLIDGVVSGKICMLEKKTGLFNSYTFNQLILNDKTYNMYPIGFGKEDAKNPIYYEDKQIALVKKGTVVYDDFHKYEILAKDDDAALIAVLFAIYSYATCVFSVGTKVKEFTAKYYSKSNNKELLSKHNPSFEEEIVKDELKMYLEKFENVFGDIVPFRQISSTVTDEQLIAAIKKSIKCNKNLLPQIFGFSKK